jgi:hypothetical protein
MRRLESPQPLPQRPARAQGALPPAVRPLALQADDIWAAQPDAGEQQRAFLAEIEAAAPPIAASLTISEFFGGVRRPRAAPVAAVPVQLHAPPPDVAPLVRPQLALQTVQHAHAAPLALPQRVLPQLALQPVLHAQPLPRAPQLVFAPPLPPVLPAVWPPAPRAAAPARVPRPAGPPVLAWAQPAQWQLDDDGRAWTAPTFVAVLEFLMVNGGANALTSNPTSEGSSKTFFSLLIKIASLASMAPPDYILALLTRLISSLPLSRVAHAHPPRSLRNRTFMDPPDWAAFFLRKAKPDQMDESYYTRYLVISANEVADEKDYDDASRDALIYAVSAGSRVSGVFPPRYRAFAPHAPPVPPAQRRA